MHHRRLLRLAAVAPVAALALAWSPRHHDGGHDSRRFPVVDRSERSERWQLPAGGGRVVVDGITGSISVRAVDGDTVTVRVREEVRGRDAAAIALARREMPVVMEQRGETVSIVVESPFRRERGGIDVDWDDVDYRVAHDFELTVPRRAAVDLRTVNAGEVELVGTDGDFEVRNVNGGIRVEDVAGSGSARTVNGEVLVSFRRNPQRDCEIASVNGDVTAELQPGLAADVRYYTMNGEGWSDFPFTVVAPEPAPAGERRNGRFRVRGRWQDGIRIGAGGPTLSFETLNGDVYLKNRS